MANVARGSPREVLPSEYGRLGFESVTGRKDPFDGTDGATWMELAVKRLVADSRNMKGEHRELVKARKRAN